MTIAEQFELALEFMVLGMGTVFAFLVILVLVVKLTGSIIQKIERPGATAGGSQIHDTTASLAESDESIAAVITAAVHQYRKQFPVERN